jgi:hypothetical protein
MRALSPTSIAQLSAVIVSERVGVPAHAPPGERLIVGERAGVAAQSEYRGATAATSAR